MLAPALTVTALANILLGSLALYAVTLLVALYFATAQFRHFVIPRDKV